MEIGRSAPGVEFIDENGSGPGVRLRKPAKPKRCEGAGNVAGHDGRENVALAVPLAYFFPFLRLA